jgi:tetratricopeptide (TPR) repeat protein
MIMPTDRPIVFLAFADAKSDLSTLKIEGWSLRDQFDELKQRGVIADVLVEERASLERIYSVFQKHRDRIALFHFGGHADADHLLLDSALGPSQAHASGLATLLGQQRGLKLVFLNGCSTRPQVKRLLDAGVPAVIATARPIDDDVATKFAVGFYQALTTGYRENGCDVTGGCSLATAFVQAQGLIKAKRGEQSRDLLAATPTSEDIADEGGFPWEARYGSSVVERWSLFEDDPLYGLPAIPDNIPDPPSPFRHLERYTRNHARVFFGRGRSIRGLYELIRNPAAAPVILYHGPTGVGKSSVLDAGLIPRLEEAYRVLYVRRDPDLGLLGTILSQLPLAGEDSNDLRRRWLSLEAAHPGSPLILVLDQAEEAFTRPMARPPSVLDAEALRHPWVDPAAELSELAEALRATFAVSSSDRRPCGRLILSFRKEWLQEITAAFDAAPLRVELLPLLPLDRSDLIEVVEGPARLSRYCLQVDPQLASLIADDLLADPDAQETIAPTVQVLLSRMWAEYPQSSTSRVFDRKLYLRLRKAGLLLRDFLEQRLLLLSETQQQAVASGLALDVLKAHTTDWGTAKAVKAKELAELYPARADEVLRLADRLHELYLLASPPFRLDDQEPRRALAHDTLAPLVREKFFKSIAPAQRSRRLLENLAKEWEGGAEGTLLDASQLRTVQQGLSAMRRLEPHENRLIEASRRVVRRQRFRRSAFIGALVGALAMIVILVLGGWIWYRTVEHTRDITKRLRAANAAAAMAEARKLRDQATMGAGDQTKWKDAIDAAKRARDQLVGHPDQAAVQEAVRLLADLERDHDMVKFFDNIKLEKIKLAGLPSEGMNRAHEEYGRAFRRYGIDLARLEPEEAGARIRVCAIHTQLSAGLLDWALGRRAAEQRREARLQPPDGRGWAHLLATARVANPSPWNSRFCEALRREDQKELRELARTVDLEFRTVTELHHLAIALATMGDQIGSEQILRQAVRRHPDDFWLNAELAKLLLQAASSSTADHAQKELELGRTELPRLPTGEALEKWHEAVRFCTAAVALRGQDAPPHYLLGSALQGQGQQKEAMDEFKEAIRIDPKNPDAHLSYSIGLCRLGDIDQAIAEVEESIRLKRDNVHAYATLSTYLQLKGKLKESIAACLEAIRLEPDAENHYRLGTILSANGDTDQAIASFRAAIQLKPDDARARWSLASALQSSGKLDEAIAECREAIRLNPRLARAHVTLGGLLHLKGRFDEAINSYKEAIRLNPDDTAVRGSLNLALALKRQQEPLRRRIAELRDLIRHGSADAVAHADLGLCLNNTGDLVGAADQLREAIRLKPDFVVAHTSLAIVLQQRGELDAAITEFREALRLKPDDANAHSTLGSALWAKGKREEAIAELREANRIDPNDAFTRQKLKLFEVLSGK